MSLTAISVATCPRTCVFCREISSGTMPEEYAKRGILNRIVYEDEEFVIFPSLSPLAVGHVMLVPKEHVTSSVQLRRPAFARLEALRLAIQDQRGTLLFWEHGIAIGAAGGCGVSHAHVHALPLPTESARRLEARLAQEFPDAVSIPFAALSQEVGSESSYLHWSTRAHGYVDKDTRVASQFMRRAVADALGSPSWDWRDLENWDLFESTLKTWQHRPLVAPATL